MRASGTLLSLMLDYIDRHSDNPDLGAATLEAKFNCSPRYAHRLLAGTGRSVGQHVNEKAYPCLHAKPARLHGSSQVDCGDRLRRRLSRRSHFNRLFKCSNDATPREFRRAVASVPNRKGQVGPETQGNWT
jgi:AraC-like DNA-binding protein